MTLKVSTGLRNKLLDTGSLATIFSGGKIQIYSGTVPSSADAAVSSGNLLCSITLSGGAGTHMASSASGGVLTKATAEAWAGTVGSSGVATFYRHVATGDDGTASATQARLQGAVSTAGAELNLSSTTLVSGATQTIDYYSVALPTL
jgi:hypothetical protein